MTTECNHFSLTYEHCIVQRLYRDVYIGDAERNYYVDEKREINLCVHYTTRIPGRYEFIPSYDFYVTKGRKSLDLHWSIGHIDNEFVIAKYTSLLEAETSEFFLDFHAMKEHIESEILRQSQLPAVNTGDTFPSYTYRNIGNNTRLTLCECFYAGTMEYVQLHCWATDQKLSTSRLPVSTLWRFLDDFYEIDSRELNLLTYLSLDEVLRNVSSPYHQLCSDMLEYLRHINSIPPNE